MRKSLLFFMAVSILLTNAVTAQPTAPSAPLKPTQSPVVPGKAPSTAEAASPLGAIQRSNPVVVPPPQTNSAEQSYSRGSGFASQYGTKPDPKVTSAPPATGKVGTDTLVGGVGADAARGDAGKAAFSGDKAYKATPVPPPTPKAAPSQPPVSARQGGPKDFVGSTNPDRLGGGAGNDKFDAQPNSAAGIRGAGKDTLTYERRPNPSIQPITPAPSPATQAGQQGKR
jgi:hypothetical protein